MSLERAHEGFSEIVRLMEPRPGRIEFATRLAVICALTVLVVEVYQTPDAALTVYVVFFLNRDNRAVSLILNFALLVLITVIIGFVLLVAMVVINDPMWRVISMTAISIAILFVASASKLRPIGGIIALIVGYALDLLGTTPLANGELATRSLLYAWLFVGIPAGVSMIVNLLLAPPPRRLAERGIARGLELSGTMLQAPNENIRSEFREHLREGMAEIQKLLGLADREKTSKPDDIAALRQAADSTTLLMSAIDVLDRRPEAQLAMPLADYLARTLREMSSILRAGGYPIQIGWDLPEMERALTPLEADVLGDIKEAIIHFAEAPSSEHRAKEAKKEGGGFFVVEAFSNPDYIRYALKATAAAIPIAAVCVRFDRLDLLRPWESMFNSFAKWHLMRDDLLDWGADARAGNPTWLLSEAQRRRSDGESLAEWMGREGFAWVKVIQKTWLDETIAAAAELSSPGLLNYLRERERLFALEIDSMIAMAEACQALRKVDALLGRGLSSNAPARGVT